jgi:beta-mannosidase
MRGHLDLNGIWKLRSSDGMRGRVEYALRERFDPLEWIDAQVRGEVHLDLWRAGLIADPYVAANVLAARWVEEFLWSYRRTFTLNEIPAGRAWIVFEGLDLYAEIFLNGKLVGKHHNAFRPCRVEVTGELRAGENVLVVHLDSGLWAAADKPAKGYEHGPDQILHKRHWLRKPQCQFGWDWSQRLINVGIFKPVRLEWTDQPARIDQFTALATLSEDLQHGTIVARLFIEGFAEHDARLIVNDEVFAVKITPGMNRLEATIHVENPQLWWPIGHGDQPRHRVRASLEIDGEIIGQREAPVGFRHVRVDQSPNPRGGKNFTFVINGRKIFAKGANLVPADMIFARIDRARYEKLIELSIEQHLNFLRVWGGGLYESDDFYDLCDERGILVWQEFDFACSRYPATDEEFFKEVLAEATHNVRRLASHPSLIAWCGNNEIEWGDWDWDYGRSGQIMPDHALFHIAVPRLLSAEDPTRYYQPSSPFSPDGMHPNDARAGDQHARCSKSIATFASSVKRKTRAARSS